MGDDVVILVDWGTTNLRFYRGKLGQSQPLEKRSCPEGGIQQLKFFQRTDRPQGELYAEMVQNQIGDWLSESPDAPILMGGVIGTQEGWSIAPYFQCPVNADTLAHNLHRVPAVAAGVLQNRTIFIVPGLKVTHPGDRRYVMRSEEIKAFGALDSLPAGGNNIVHMPGTHCQWLHMKNDTIDSFWTFQAGEVYDRLLRHGSISSFLPAEEPDDLPSFERGLKIANQGYDLLTDIHNVRSQRMTGENPPRSYRHYLSGVVLGHEILGAAKVFGKTVPLTLVADPSPKRDLYLRAYEFFEWPVAAVLPSEELFLKGLQRLCSHLPV